jgi:hypothetical protein
MSMARQEEQSMGSYRWRKLLVDRGDLFDIYLTSSESSPVVPAVRTGAYSRAFVATGHHWSGYERQHRLVG